MARSYPTDWIRFCDIEKKHGGFTNYNLKAGTTIGDLNRFAARYSLAKDFEKIVINNSTPDTMLGYEALMRSLFVWSASEAYHKVLSGTGGKYKYLFFTTLEKSGLNTSLNAIGPDIKTFYTFILNNCETFQRPEINNFLAGNDFNPMYLLASIRHVFSHGELSANVEGVNPKSIKLITEVLKDIILDKIDTHFTALVQSHPNY